MNAKRILIAMAVVLFVAGTAIQVHGVRAAATRSFTLYGNHSLGWGNTSSSISSPGPTIRVEQGDTVNLTLISNDGVSHQFFVSYLNHSSHSQGDPESNVFTGTIYFHFVATNNIGTYTYFCAFHPNIMYGHFQIVKTGGIPEFQPLTILALLFLSTSIAALVCRRVRHTASVNLHLGA